MSEVIIYRFDVAGRWTKTAGVLNDKYVVDNKREQAHVVRRSDFFVPNKPAIIAESIEEATNRIPPEPPPNQHQRAIVVEDHGVLPLIASAAPPPIELIERNMHLSVATAETEAPLIAEHKDSKGDGQLLWYRMLAGAFMLVVFSGLGIAAAVWMFTAGPAANGFGL